MKIYLNKNVLEAAKERIEFIFDEFKNVVVAYSGGKDSVVCFEIAMEIAKQKGRTPLPVLFIDQEAEWEGTVEMVRSVMYRDDVQPYWLQIPFLLDNAVSYGVNYRMVWEPGREWIRAKEPISIKENKYGHDYMIDLFGASMDHEFNKEPVGIIGGVRAEESPARTMSLTTNPIYKWVTWGKRTFKNKYHFAPIYDWSYTDVWKAIHEHGWKYNNIYDKQYSLGLGVQQMRVSSFHHSQAIQNIFYMQQAEPHTYQKMTALLEGIDTSAKLGFEDYYPTKLPFMFRSWVEYRDYLSDKLFQDEGIKRRFKQLCEQGDDLFTVYDYMFPGEKYLQRWAAAGVQSVLSNDIYFVKLDNFRAGRDNTVMRKAKARWMKKEGFESVKEAAIAIRQRCDEEADNRAAR